MKSYHYILLLLLLLGVSACEQKSSSVSDKKVQDIPLSKIEGSVFIVTKGGQNIKLGLVEVGLAEENEANTAVHK